MDMKRILQAFDGASTKPVEGANDMARFLRLVNEAEVGQAAQPAGQGAPTTQTASPQQDPKFAQYAQIMAKAEMLEKEASGAGEPGVKTFVDPATTTLIANLKKNAATIAGANLQAWEQARKAGGAPQQSHQALAGQLESKKSGLIKKYFEAVQRENVVSQEKRRTRVQERARRIAAKMLEDAKVTAIDPAKKTVTYSDPLTGITTTIPQGMAKPNMPGQVTVDKTQVNQAAGQQSAQPIKVGDTVKVMDKESMSAGVRMQRALQREKERRERSERYAQQHFPIGKPLPKPEKEKEQNSLEEKWSEKYKRSINCSHPKGFSQRAHCQGKKKHNESLEMESVCPDCGMCETHGNNMLEVKQRLDAKCWKGKHKEGTKIKGGVRVNNCVPNESVSEGNETPFWGDQR